MKKTKQSNQNERKYFNFPKTIKFYKASGLIALGMIGLFTTGFWLMSLLDQHKEESSKVDTSVSDSKSTLPNSDLKAKSKVFAYNLVAQSKFIPSAKVQAIVDNIVKYTTDKHLPIGALSVTLIDANTGEIAEHQGQKERYPASVVKMFWLVAIYQKINKGDVDGSSLKSSIEQMIYKSDNQGASQVLDKATGTKSTTDKLPESEFNSQKQQRQSLNEFFRQAGYSQNINVSQKTFPIPQENIMEPKGFDQQLRGENPDKPVRNKLTTNDAARLMYEIVNNLAVSPEISKKMRELLTRDIDPNYWKSQPPNPIDFNPVESFFGEGLPANKAENIVSKAGWTSASRQEVAFITSKDGKTRYILAVFGDDAAYGKSKKVFPEISDLVYKQMRQLSK